MYSVVLMMALSGGAESTAWCYGCGCYGCGCYSCGCYSCGCGCYSYGCGCGCYSYGCGCGCYSYGCGCGCGCYSYGCGCGCYSYGCGCGCYSYGCGCYSCGCGSYSCGCGCYGCGSYGCHSCGSCGCAHGGVIHGGGVVVQPGPGAPVGKDAPPPPPPGKGPGKAPGKPPAPPVEKISAPAQIEVTVPDQTVLKFDGHTTTQTTGLRRFHTPALASNANGYVYTVQAERTVDGQNVVKTQQIVVRAGETTRVTIDFDTAGVASR